MGGAKAVWNFFKKSFFFKRQASLSWLPFFCKNIKNVDLETFLFFEPRHSDVSAQFWSFWGFFNTKHNCLVPWTKNFRCPAFDFFVLSFFLVYTSKRLVSYLFLQENQKCGFGINFSFLNHGAPMLCRNFEVFKIFSTQNTFWGYLGDISGISWRYLGNVLGISWEYLGDILGISWGP